MSLFGCVLVGCLVGLFARLLVRVFDRVPSSWDSLLTGWTFARLLEHAFACLFV